MSKFVNEIKAFARHAGLGIDETYRGATLELFKSIINDTVVDTGMLRGNWQTSIGTPKGGELQVPDKTGSIAIAAAVKGIGKPNEVTWFVNNLPYAKAIEEGHSKRAPNGMVRKNIIRWRRLVNKHARKAGR